MPAGKHLFPFRTEKLSLPAPMVLGEQSPGRVGRRPFLYEGPGNGPLVFVNCAFAGVEPQRDYPNIGLRRAQGLAPLWIEGA